MNTERMIDITGSNLVSVVKAAYDLSSPQGLGFLHYEDGGLSDEEASHFVNEGSPVPVSLEYVKGRACKLSVFRQGGKLFINDFWFDHSEDQLLQLIDRIAA